MDTSVFVALSAFRVAIDAAEENLSKLRAERLELWHCGRLIGLKTCDLAAASGVTGATISQATRGSALKVLTGAELRSEMLRIASAYNREHDRFITPDEMAAELKSRGFDVDLAEITQEL